MRLCEHRKGAEGPIKTLHPTSRGSHNGLMGSKLNTIASIYILVKFGKVKNRLRYAHVARACNKKRMKTPAIFPLILCVTDF